ncbi:MAG: hypothetical protein ABSD50_17465, partial [Smithella sp.]
MADCTGIRWRLPPDLGGGLQRNWVATSIGIVNQHLNLKYFGGQLPILDLITKGDCKINDVFDSTHVISPLEK